MQGLYSVDVENSAYAIEDDGAGLVAGGLAQLDKPGITSITLVDTANSDRADAAQGASLTEISGSLTNGAA